MKARSIFILIAAAGMAFTSCKKKGCTDPAASNYNPDAKKDDGSCVYPDPEPTGYAIPDNYEFDRNGSTSVSFGGQLDRRGMLAELTVEMKKGNTVGTTVNANTLYNMFHNFNSPFFDNNLNTSSKKLYNKCFAADTAFFNDLMDSLAVASTATDTAVPGRAGVIVTGSGGTTSGYLVDANGMEYTQVVEKGLMGAIFYYQAMETYLSTDLNSDDNTNLVSGKNYTEMEHHFDEAFGYFGAPTDFPNAATLGNAVYHAKYCNKREDDSDGDYAGINNQIMDNFIKARAAIVAKETTDRDAAIKVVQDTWETVIGATAVEYLRDAKDDSPYKRMHHLSEAIGFMMSLKYKFNGGNSMNPPISTYSHVQMALAIVGPNVDLYAVTNNDIDTAIGHLLNAFPGGEVK